MDIGTLGADTRHVPPYPGFALRARLGSLALALAVGMGTPNSLGAQQRSVGTSLAVLATVLPVCRMEAAEAPVVSAVGAGTFDVTLNVTVTTNVEVRIVTRVSPRRSDAGRSVRVRDAAGRLRPAPALGGALRVAHVSAGSHAVHVAYRVTGVGMTAAAALDALRASLSCVVEDERLANGAVLTL
jgi:hypothetical protein